MGSCKKMAQSDIQSSLGRSTNFEKTLTDIRLSFFFVGTNKITF